MEIKKTITNYLQLNGVQWVYILSDLRFSMVSVYGVRLPCATFKIGFTGNHGKRQRDIQENVKSIYSTKVYRVLAFPILSANHVEQEMHEFFSKWKTDKYYSSSGGSEWFSRPNFWVAAFALVIGLLHTGLPALTALFYSALFLFLPLPLDAIICTFLGWTLTSLRRSFFYVLELAMSLGSVALIWKFFAMII
jgi:hypothetical protein